MNRTAIAVGGLALAAALTGCSSHNGEYHAVCTDSRTDQVLPDSYCSSPQPYSGWYYVPWNTWHDQVEVHHHYYTQGTHVSGGTTVAPKASTGAVKVQYAGRKQVTVYQPAKQAGSSVKTNQDARKVSTVTGSKSYSSSRSSSFGSSSKSYSSTNRSSSFGGRR